MWRCCAWLMCVSAMLFHTTSAAALTVDGEEYEKFLSISTDGSFGYWLVMNKFYTNEGLSSEPIDVTSVLYRDPALDGAAIREVSAMGTTESTYGPVDSSFVQLFGEDGELLLAAEIVPSGTMTVDDKYGHRGEIGVEGLYTVTGGVFATGGFIGSTIFINFIFDYVTILAPTDIHATKGKFEMFRRAAPTCDVPEPASALMLLSGGLLIARFRGRKISEGADLCS